MTTSFNFNGAEGWGEKEVLTERVSDSKKKKERGGGEGGVMNSTP